MRPNGYERYEDSPNQDSPDEYYLKDQDHSLKEEDQIPLEAFEETKGNGQRSTQNRFEEGTIGDLDAMNMQEDSKNSDLVQAKHTYYDANEIIEELSDESNFIETPNKKWIGNSKYSRFLRSGQSSDLPMRPYLKQLLKDVINSDFLYYIADFLDTKTIIYLTGVSTVFKNSFRVYLPTRLQQEADYINLFIETNEELNKEFMKLVDTQIPISNGNWVNFNFLDTLRNIASSLTTSDISNLKFKCRGNWLGEGKSEDADLLFAPF